MNLFVWDAFRWTEYCLSLSVCPSGMGLFSITRISCFFWGQWFWWQVKRGSICQSQSNIQTFFGGVVVCRGLPEPFPATPSLWLFCTAEVSLLRQSCLDMYIWRTGAGLEAIVLFVVWLQALLQSLSPTSPFPPPLLCWPVIVSGPGEHSPPSLAPPHSLSGKESCCSSGKTCLRHKTCTTRREKRGKCLHRLQTTICD